MKLLGKAIVAIVFAASIFGAATTAHAAALSISDSALDARAFKGSPTAAMYNQTDITRVTYWVSGDWFYVRFQVRDLRSDHRTPEYNLTGRAGNYRAHVDPGARTGALYINGGAQCFGMATHDYTNNWSTAGYQRSCFPKGGKFTAPHGSSTYTSGDGRFGTSDYTGEGPSIIVNP